MSTAIQMRSTAYHLRQSVAADERFLFELYAQTRADELIRAGMDSLQREVFVQMQFKIRHAAYTATYPTALSEMICADSGTSIGRVLTDRMADEMCLIDIALMSEHQNQGIGTQVIRKLQQECMAQAWKMKLQVLKGNAAESLYRRLGFKVTGEDPLRRQMVWDGTKI